MARLTDCNGNNIDVFKVYGHEERDAHSINILVDHELINDRFPMTRAEFKANPPSENDYLYMDKNGNPSFITNTDLDALLSPEKSSIPSDIPPPPAGDAPPVTSSIDPAMSVAPDDVPQPSIIPVKNGSTVSNDDPAIISSEEGDLLPDSPPSDLAPAPKILE